jgi:hypothetical protein
VSPLRPILLASVAAALAGCAQLNVRVDVIDPSYMKAWALDAALRQDAMRIARGDTSEVDEFVGRQAAIYRKFRLDCLREARSAASLIPDAQQRGELIADLDEAIGEPPSGIEQWRRDSRNWLLSGDRRRRDMILSSYPGAVRPDARPQPLPAALQAELSARRAQFNRLSDQLFGMMAGQTGLCSQLAADFEANLSPETAEAVDEAAARESRAATRSILGGGALLNDRMEAYYVTSAPDEVWAPRYNRAFGAAVGGGSDIALKMNDTADFSVKGFTFDARSTAEMLRKVTGSTLQVIAAAYGAPLPAPKSGAGGAATPAAANPVTDQQRELLAAQAQSAAYQSALFHIADAVIAEAPRLTKGDASAKARAKAAFEAHRNVWRAAAEPPKP